MAEVHRIRRRGMAALLYGVAMAGLVGQVQAESLEARAIGATVVAEDFNGDDFEWGPFNNAKGTMIAVLLSVPEGDARSIVDVDGQGSDLSLLTDSTGRDLTQPLPKVEGQDDGFGSMNEDAGFDPFPKLSKDNKQAVVEVRAPRSPAKEATSVNLKGTLQISVASGQDKSLVKAVKLAEGDLAAAGHTVRITEVKEQEWFDEKTLEVTFELKGESAESFAELRLLGTDGQPLDGAINSTMSFGQTLMATFALKDASVKQADVELSFWKEFEQLSVPLDMTVQVGGF